MLTACLAYNDNRSVYALICEYVNFVYVQSRTWKLNMSIRLLAGRLQALGG